jgi:DNA-binding NarL/FixJ family response regulator
MKLTKASKSTSDKISYLAYTDQTHARARTSPIIQLYNDGWIIREISKKLKLRIQTVKDVVLTYIDRTA